MIDRIRLSANCANCKEKCCQRPYDWIYLTEAEVDRLEEASGKSRATFVVEKKNSATGDIFKLLLLPCLFFDSQIGQCRVYANRPLVCKLYPIYVDPLLGEACLLPSDCGENLRILPATGKEGWHLHDHAEEILDWINQVWYAARSNKSPEGSEKN